MQRRELPIHGRGTSSNPPNRFERLVLEPNPDEHEEEAPAPATQFYRDETRTIVARNDSPDVGFEISVNPYRGCEHGCVYCLSGDTPILMANGLTRPLHSLRPGDAIYGTVRRGWYRRYVRTHVFAHWRVRRAAFRITLADGTCLIAGANHRFLTQRGWKFVSGTDRSGKPRPRLTTNNKLMGVGAFATPPEEADDYKKGYLAGMIRGDGLLGSYVYDGRRRDYDSQYQFRLALVDDDGLAQTARYLLDFGLPTHGCLFKAATETRKRLEAIRTSARSSVERIQQLIAWPTAPCLGWDKGFLAGIYDSEGGFSNGALRISNTDLEIIRQTEECLDRLSFEHVRETQEKGRSKAIQVVRLLGGLQEHLRFFHTTGTAIVRKRDIAGQAVKSSANLRVVSIEAMPRMMLLYDITTGTGDFIANGVVSHNCYARPYHEYLGFSAGLDFETRIMVKEDAPELLRRELMHKSWVPQTVGLCGVTDAYQPVERRLRLTRRCVEVLAEFRNPVTVVTKNRLVARDADLFGALAAVGAASVYVSVTTLDPELAAVMEPRASRPAARLDAIRELSVVGVPVGVLVAPIIPGLTDHEMPAILAAVKEAGARFAGYVMLRLPLGVGPLFEAWLDQHFPGKKERVLGRVREAHGGQLNDSRFGVRMVGEGALAEQVRALFRLTCTRLGIDRGGPSLSAASFRRPGGQLMLFD